MREKILAYALRYQGEYYAMKKAIEKNEPVNKINYNGNYITILDDEYPKSLLELKHPPYILFYEGNLDLLDKRGVSVIGSRLCSDYGAKMTSKIVRKIAIKNVIISGLAKGIDAYAHKEAINLNTIAIVGCGLDICYPKENFDLYQLIKKKHLILSEYPYGTKPLAHHFPWRNRLIAALSQSVVVIEAKKRSGTLFTVNEALELGKSIYCVPHEYDNVSGWGCNYLIQQGAQILVDENDLDTI